MASKQTPFVVKHGLVILGNSPVNLGNSTMYVAAVSGSPTFFPDNSKTYGLSGHLVGSLSGIGYLDQGTIAVTQPSSDISTLVATTKFVNDAIAGTGQLTPALQAKWDSAHTTLRVTSGNWETAFNKVDTQLGEWDSTWNTLTAASANWESTYVDVARQIQEWDSTWTTLTGGSANWDSVYSTVNETSGEWGGVSNKTDTVYTTVNDNSGNWTWVADNSATMYSDLLLHGNITGPTDTDLDVKSDKNIRLYLDSDDDGSFHKFQIHNGDEDTIFAVAESGNTVIGGPVTGTSLDGLTVVGNISATGVLYADQLGNGDSSQWFSTYTKVYSQSGIWDGTYTTVKAESGGWEDAHAHSLVSHAPANADNTAANETSHADVVVDGDFGNDGILTRTSAGNYGYVTDNSFNWDATYTTVSSLSDTWKSTYEDVILQIDEWNSTWNTLTGVSANWEAAIDDVTEIANVSARWDSTATDVNETSGLWDSTYTHVYDTSGLWDATYTSVHGTSAVWNAAVDDITEIANVSARWDSTHTDVYANSSAWVSTATDVNETSSAWDSTHTDVYANSASWISTNTDVGENSGLWDATYTTVHDTSAYWKSTYEDVLLQIDEWDSTWNTLTATSALWDQHHRNISEIAYASAGWESQGTAATTVRTESAFWDATYSTVNAESGDWASTAQGGGWTDGGDHIYASSNSDSVVIGQQEAGEEKLTVIGHISGTGIIYSSAGNSDHWSSAYTDVNANSSAWVSTATDVNETSGLWDAVYTTVHANSGTGTINKLPLWTTAEKIGDSILSQATDNDGGKTVTVAGSAVVQGDLTIQGDFTYLNTEVQVTDQIIIANLGTGPALKVTQQGIQPVAEFIDDGVTVFKINNGGSIDVYSTIDGRNISDDGAILDSVSTDVNISSGTWDSVVTDVNANSASWDSVVTDVNANSANWSSTYTHVNEISSAWDSVATDVNANSSAWVSTATDVNANSSAWVSTATDVNANSSAWVSTATDVNANSSAWDSARTDVYNNSASWNSVITDVNVNSASWISTNTDVNANSASWDSVVTDVNANSASWISTNTDVNETSGLWDAVYSTVYSHSGMWGQDLELGALSGHANSTYLATFSAVTLSQARKWNSGIGFWSHSGMVEFDNAKVNDSVYNVIAFKTTSIANAAYVQLDVGESLHGTKVAFTKVEIWSSGSTSKELTVQYSDDGTNFVSIDGATIQPSNGATAQWVYSGAHRYWRLTNLDGSWAGGDADPDIYEIQFYESILVNSEAPDNSTEWTSTFTDVNANSASWGSTHTDVNANSASWESTRTDVNANSASWESTRTDVYDNSASWISTYTSVYDTSGLWDATYTSVYDTSGLWDATYTSVYNTSGLWDATYTSVSDTSGLWDATYSTMHLESGGWETTAGTVGLRSGLWDAVYTTVGTYSGEWGGGKVLSVFTTVNESSAAWDSTHTDVNANSSAWVSTATDVNETSGLWDAAYSTVNTSSGGWQAWEITDAGNAKRPDKIGINISTAEPQAYLDVNGSMKIAGDVDISVGSFTVHSSALVEYLKSGTLRVADNNIQINWDGNSGNLPGAGLTIVQGSVDVAHLKLTSNADGWELKTPDYGGATGKILTLDIDADKTIKVEGDLDIEADSKIDQDLTTDSSTVEFVGMSVGGVTADEWSSGLTTLTAHSASWESTNTNVNANSANWSWVAETSAFRGIWITDIVCNGGSGTTSKRVYNDIDPLMGSPAISGALVDTPSSVTFTVEWEGPNRAGQPGPSVEDYMGLPTLSGHDLVVLDAGGKVANTSNVTAIGSLGDLVTATWQLYGVDNVWRTVENHPLGRYFRATITLDYSSAEYSSTIKIPYGMNGVFGEFELEKVGGGPIPVAGSVDFGSYPSNSFPAGPNGSPAAGSVVQTALKSGDTISVSIDWDTDDVAQVEIASYGASSSLQTFSSPNPTGDDNTTALTMTIGGNSGTQYIQVRAKNAFGTYGDWVVMNNTGAGDESVTMDQTTPSASLSLGSYPSGQEALKGSETIAVNASSSSGDRYLWATPLSRGTINGRVDVLENKTFTNTYGSYDISNSKVSLIAYRTTNGKTSSTAYANPFIAAVAATIQVWHSTTAGSHTPVAATMQTGGWPGVDHPDDGNGTNDHQGGHSSGDLEADPTKSNSEHTSNTTYYAIFYTSQVMKTDVTPTLAVANGTTDGSLGSMVHRGGYYWWDASHTFDEDIVTHGTKTWGNFSCTNKAGIVTNSGTFGTYGGNGGSTFTIQGFVSRLLKLPGQAVYHKIGTTVGGTKGSGLTVSETFRGAITPDTSLDNGATLDPDSTDAFKKYTIVNYSSPNTVAWSGDTIWYLDKTARETNSSGTAEITITDA